MKRTIVISIGEENKEALIYLDYLMRLSLNSSVDDLIRTAVIEGEQAKNNASTESLETRLKIQQVILGSTKNNGEDYDFSPLFIDFIRNSEAELNKESIVVEHKELKIEPGINLVFIGSSNDPIFLSLLKSFKSSGIVNEKVYIATIFTKGSFEKENLPTTLSVSETLNNLSFSNLQKKIIITDVNKEGNTVSTKEIYSNLAIFLFNLIIDSPDNNIRDLLKTRTDLIKTEASGTSTSTVDCNFISTGNATMFLPIETLRCNVSKDLTNKFVRNYLDEKLVDEKQFSIIYEDALKDLQDLISYSNLSAKLKDELAKMKKEEGILFRKLGNPKNIPFNRLVEELVNYQTLLLSGDLHLSEQTMRNWLKEDFKISESFLQKIKIFEKNIVSKASFISLTEGLAKLLEVVSSELKENSPVSRAKNHKKVSSHSSQTLNTYRELLSRKIRRLPKTLPYYLRYSLLSVFLGYLGFLGTKAFYTGSFKGDTLPYAVAAVIILLILFFAWFSMWKWRKEILYIAGEWQSEIESNYESIENSMINRVASDALEEEIKITKREIDKYKERISSVKNTVLGRVASKEFLECPEYTPTFRFISFGEDYYKKKMSEKLKNSAEIFSVMNEKVTVIRDPELFDSSTPEAFANKLVRSTDEASHSIVEENDADINLSSILFEGIAAEEEQNENVVHTVKDLISKSPTLVSLNTSLACADVNFVHERYLFLPKAQKPANNYSNVKLVLNNFDPGVFKNVYSYRSYYLMTVLEVVYDFPLRTISYFTRLREDIKNNNLSSDIVKKVREILQEKEGD